MSEPEQFEDVDELFANLPHLAREFRRSRRRQAFLLAFVTLIGLVAGTFLQRASDENAHTLRETRDTAFDQCRIANDNARALNQFLDVAVASVRANTTLTQSEKDYRVSLYASIKQKLPICEAP